MAKWKRPKVWVSVVCIVACAAVLAACAFNPQKEKESLEDLTQTAGPASVGIGELFFRLPDGYTMVMREAEEQPEGSQIWYEHIISRGETVVGGVLELDYPDFQRNPEEHNTWDWVAALDVPEKVPEERLLLSVSTGIDTPYSLSAFYGQKGVEETAHYFFEGSNAVYDLWFNLEAMSQEEKNAILDTAGMEQSKDGELVSVEVASGEIQQGNQVRTDIELVTYGSLKMALPEKYESREEDGNVILTKEGVDVGGITCWSHPGFEPDDMIEWVKALGLPELQEDYEVPIGYMAGGSIYGDLEIEIFQDGNPELLNEEHEFFIDGDVVYDVWYDQNLISDGIAERFLKSVAINAAPVIKENPGEQAAFAKCRAVLEAVQKGSYKIVTRHVSGRGENIMAHERIYTRTGEDWLSVTNALPAGDDFTGEEEFAITKSALRVNGKHYNFTGTEWVEIADAANTRLPWLAEFIWDDNIVAYIDTQTDEDCECVMLRVDEKYIDSDEYDPHYFLYFNFDPDGNFVNAQLTINLFRDNELSITESIVSLDAGEIIAEIQREHQRIAG